GVAAEGRWGARGVSVRSFGPLEPEWLRGAAAEDAVLVVEAMKIVRDLDRVRRERVRPPPLRGRRDDARELDQTLHELALLGGQLARRPWRASRAAGVAHDPRDPRVCVLHVVHGVLLRLFGGEVDIDLDRLVVATVDEVPAG